MGRLTGKVALITGTGVGMGRAAAMRFAAEGATVAGCDLNPHTSEETVRMVRDAGGSMTATAPVDLSSYEATQEWIDEVATNLGGIDVLYNNASLPVVGPWDDLTVEGWHAGIRNELDLVFYAAQGRLAPSRRPRRRQHHQRRLDRVDPWRRVLSTGCARGCQGRCPVVHVPPRGRRRAAPHSCKRDPARPHPHSIDGVPLLLTRRPRQHVGRGQPVGSSR